MTKLPKMIIGNLEICNLPDLDIQGLQVRVDTGAKTSSLHVDNLECINRRGQPIVEFDLHPDIYNLGRLKRCSAKVIDVRRIKSSNGDVEERYVIATSFEIGGRSWPIEVTLTNRSDMSYMMLLGRQGMAKHVLVDPSKSYVLGESTDD